MKILLVAKYESQDHIEIWNFRNWLLLSHPATRTLRIWCSGENTERSTQIQRSDEKALNYNVWLLQDIHYFLIFWQMFWSADVPEWKRHEIISLNFNIVNPLQFCSEFAFYGFCTKASFILSFNLHRPRTVGALDMGGASMQVRNHQSNHYVLSSLLFLGQLSMSCFCGSIYTIVFVNTNCRYTRHVNKRQK